MKKLWANNEDNDEKAHKGRRVYHTFADVTFSVLVPAVVGLSLVIERLRVRGNVFIPVQEDQGISCIPSPHVSVFSGTEPW